MNGIGSFFPQYSLPISFILFEIFYIKMKSIFIAIIYLTTCKEIQNP